GVSLGLAAATWNVVGQIWIDLWHAHDGDGDETQGFVAFFQQFQKVRLNVPVEHATLAHIVERTVAAISDVDAVPVSALAEHGDAHHALGAVGISDPELRGLADTIARWDALRRFFTNVSQRLDPEPADLEQYGDLPAENKPRAFLDGLAQAAQISDFEHKANAIVRILEDMGVRFEIDTSMNRGPYFRVTAERSGSVLRLKPSVHLGSPGKVAANGCLMLLHELGHAALHCSYVSQLTLMHYCSELLESERPLAATQVREVVSSAHKQMIEMHSAVERAADRFALRFLLTPSFVEQLRIAFVERGGRVQLFALDSVIQVRLGVDHETYYRRFGPLIWPSLGMGGMATNGVLRLTPQILDAMDEASGRRLERMLRDHWAMVRRIVAASEDAAATRRATATKRQRDLLFDAIVCVERP
ncbi:MAG TPA: hypothetical protein VNG33_14285, partial [Polyangiaceae bacterium]|nr:hypothetical protein [Polyangiaceae bacterium]